MTRSNIFASPRLPPRCVLMFPDGQCHAPDRTASQPSRTLCLLGPRQEPAPAPQGAISQAKAPPACPGCWLHMSPSLAPMSQRAGENIAWLVWRAECRVWKLRTTVRHWPRLSAVDLRQHGVLKGIRRRTHGLFDQLVSVASRGPLTSPTAGRWPTVRAPPSPSARGPGPPAGWAPEFLHESLGFSSQTFLLVKTQTSRVYPGDGAQGWNQDQTRSAHPSLLAVTQGVAVGTQEVVGANRTKKSFEGSTRSQPRILLTSAPVTHPKEQLPLCHLALLACPWPSSSPESEAQRETERRGGSAPQSFCPPETKRASVLKGVCEREGARAEWGPGRGGRRQGRGGRGQPPSDRAGSAGMVSPSADLPACWHNVTFPTAALSCAARG